MSEARDCEPYCFSARLGHDFATPPLLVDALTHRSFCAENTGATSNERLEFLGDAVLGLAVTELIFRLLPGTTEGELAKLRAAIVNAPSLAEVARTLDLGPSLRLGKGEARSGGRDKGSILADGLEAVVGAVFVDGGYAAAAALVERLFAALVAGEVARGAGGQDYKTRLQELAARQFDASPAYVVAESGPDHGKHFHATVMIEERTLGRGAGTSKKKAEQAAARAAWHVLTGGDDDAGVARS